MSSLWQRNGPIVANRVGVQAWSTRAALLGRARPRRCAWQRLEASMWTTTPKESTEMKTTATHTPPTLDAPKPEPPSRIRLESPTPPNLPGKIADVLDLADTQRVPVVTYSPTEELFTLNEDPVAEPPSLESRVAVNKFPNKWYLVQYYLKMRETMVSKSSVFHKRWRGACASATGRFLSMNDAVTTFCGNLGRADWERDPAREVASYRDFRALDAKSTTAHVEYLKSGQAAALWVTIAPERYDGAGGGGFPDTKALQYYTWANRHPPWRNLLWHLRRSPSRQLRAPSISPADENYQIYPDERRPESVGNVANQPLHQVQSCYFLHFMPLLMETFGPGGRRVNRLWVDGKQNNNLPVILSWQDMYVWFIWRNGPEGPLEMQHAGWWLPQIAPGHPNHQREQELRKSSETRLGMSPYGKPVTELGPPPERKPRLSQRRRGDLGEPQPEQPPVEWPREHLGSSAKPPGSSSPMERWLAEMGDKKGFKPKGKASP